MVKRLTTELSGGYTPIHCQIQLCSVLEISIIKSWGMFSSVKCWPFHVFPPNIYFSHGQVPTCSINRSQSPLAVFFPESEAEGRRFSLPDTVQVELL